MNATDHAGSTGSHLVVDLSGHGYGHASQTAPVVRALRRLAPGLRITVRTRVPAPIVEDLLGPVEGFAEPPPDVGLLMTSPVDVEREPSAAAYADLHARWPQVVAEQAERLSALAPDLLLSNAGYAGLAGAAAAGIPAVVMSSLNWFDIYRAYCADRPEAPRMLADMASAYGSAEAFLQVAPHLPMESLSNRRPLGPVARLGRDRGDELRRAIGAGEGERLALASLGGIAGTGGMGTLPRVPGLRWLVGPELGRDLEAGRDDVAPTAGLDLPFIDIIRAVDIVVTKPGYGTIVESVCNGTRVVYCTRPDWPETAIMDDWARAHGVASLVERADLAAGRYAPLLESLLARPIPPPPPPAGVDQAAAFIAGLLGRVGQGSGSPAKER